MKSAGGGLKRATNSTDDPIDDSLSLTLGSKFEHNDFSGLKVEPTLRVLWTPSPGHSVWLAVSRAVRTPNVTEDAASARSLPSPTVPPVFPRVTPNTMLDSEEVLTYELGHRAAVTNTLSLDLAGFYSVYDSLSARVPGAVMLDPATGTLFRPVTAQNAITARRTAWNWRRPGSRPKRGR